MVAGLQLQCPDMAAPVLSDIADWATCTPYRSLVGSLMYITIATHPDISYAVGHLSAFCNCYHLEHWSAAIHVLHYLKTTRTVCLELGGFNQLHLLGYSNLDYANCMKTSHSVGGYCFTLGLGMISWSSHKQPTVADSFCYAELVVLKFSSELRFEPEPNWTGPHFPVRVRLLAPDRTDGPVHGSAKVVFC